MSFSTLLLKINLRRCKLNAERVSLIINFVGVGIVAIAIGFFSKNLKSPDLWLDESGQFLLSMGQHHFSALGERIGSLYDSWNYSKKFNLDPGGYTVLLRFWVETFGSSPFVLRSLSLIFALIPIVLIISIAKIMDLPFSVGLIAAMLPLSNPSYLAYALEIRAYSMEFCGVIAIYWATVLLLQSTSWRYVVLWAFINILFVSSRYSATIYTVSACLILFLYFLKDRRHAGKIIVALSVISVFVFLEYYYMLRYQAATATPPDYVQQFLLYGKGFWDAAKILNENLFGYGRTLIGRQTLIISSFIFFLPVFFKFKRSRELFEISQPAHVAYAYVVVSFLMWLIMSMTGKMPWSISQRWSLSYLMLTPISFLAICSIIKPAFLGLATLRSNSFLTYGTVLLSAIALLLSIHVVNNLLSYNRGCFECLYAPIPVIKQGFRQNTSVIFSKGLYPDFKYAKDFSNIPLDDVYKNSFFTDLDDIKATKELVAKQTGPVVIVSAEWGVAQRTKLQKALGNSTLIQNLDENNVMYVLKIHR